MLDFKFIRNNIEKVKQNTVERGMNPQIVDEWVVIDKERTLLQARLEEINKLRNDLADKGMVDGNSREEGKRLKIEGKEIEVKLDELNSKWKELINQIPNIHRPEVPIGKNEEGNKEVKKVGDIPNFSFPVKDHLELAAMHDLIDFEAGAKVSGSQFYFLKNDAVKLELALLQFGINFLF